jgi:hypothetical protein
MDIHCFAISPSTVVKIDNLAEHPLIFSGFDFHDQLLSDYLPSRPGIHHGVPFGHEDFHYLTVHGRQDMSASRRFVSPHPGRERIDEPLTRPLQAQKRLSDCGIAINHPVVGPIDRNFGTAAVIVVHFNGTLRLTVTDDVFRSAALDGKGLVLPLGMPPCNPAIPIAQVIREGADRGDISTALPLHVMRDLFYGTLAYSHQTISAECLMSEFLTHADQCAVCNGEKGEGEIAPAIGNPAMLANTTDAFLRYAIRNGRVGSFGRARSKSYSTNLACVIFA